MAAPQIPPFAHLLRRHRRDCGLTQEALAEMAGLSARGNRALEQGERTAPHTDTVHLLADALQLFPGERAEFEAASRLSSSGDGAAGRDTVPSVGGFLGARPSGPLVAREGELVRALRLIEDVERGEGRLVLLAGEAGVGKTRLAQEVAVHLHNRGFVVASGRCYEPEHVVPYYPFLDALTTMLTTAPRSVRAGVRSRWPYLGWLLPDLVDAPNAIRAFGQDAEQLLFRAVTGFLEAMADVAPLALMVDDLHWADNSSLKLLLHLARHTHASRILLLGTYRDTEVGRRHPMTQALLDLDREGLAELVAAKRLSEEGTAALITATLRDAAVPVELVGLIHRRTDGNPFFVMQVLRAVMERGDLYRQDERYPVASNLRSVHNRTSRGAEIEVPENVRTAIKQRVSRLADETQAVLREASVLGQTFLYDDLHAMTGRPEEELEKALQEAGEAGLVRVIGEDNFVFDHALTQETLYGELPRRRRKLHLAVAEALERLPERQREKRAAELARHFIQGGAAQRALPYAILAGDRAAAVFAHTEAERHYHTALGLAREIENRPQEAQALEKRGRVLTNLARYEQAREALEQAAHLYRELADQQGEVRTVVQLGSVHRAAGTPDEGIVAAQALLQRLHLRGRAQDMAELGTVLETLYYSTGRYPEGLAVAERAAELAAATGDKGSLGRAEVGRGTELLMLGRREEGLHVLEGAVALAEASDDPYNLARAFINAAMGYREGGELERSRDILIRGLALQERIQNPSGLVNTLGYLGTSCRLLGEWTQARTYLERGEEIRRALGSSTWTTYFLLELGAFYVDEGAWEQASAVVEDALTIARRIRDLEMIRYGHQLLAELDLLAGYPALARERIEPLLDRPGLEEFQVTQMLPALAAAYCASGDLAQAQTTIQEAIRRATASKQIITLANAFLVRGRVMVAQELWETAQHDLAEGARLARDMPCPHLEARALYEQGVMHGEKGEPQQARERLEEALGIFQHLGARPYVERTEHALQGAN